jgi:acyl dehydratase
MTDDTDQTSAETLLTEEVRAWSRLDYPPRTIAVGVRDILRYAYAVGETDPIHVDPDAAAAAGLRGILAPPLFHYTLRVESSFLAPKSALEPDGSPTSDVPPLAARRAMAGETTVEFFGDIFAGDRITVRRKTMDLREKVGRTGPLILLRFEYTYENQEEELVVREEFTRVFR